MNAVVLKYGGSSVADLEKISAVADHIIKKKAQYDHVVVVVSAMGKSTNHLIETASKVSATPSRREMDVLLSTGEQVSIALLAMTLIAKGYPAVSMTGWQIGMLTYGHHQKSRIQDIDIQRVQDQLSKGNIVVVAGFQGINADHDITTLGRGGSDTSAVALACKLLCPCEIYTDVDGIYTVDPRLYHNARKLLELSYEETMEMASLGARVIEPRSVELACRYKIPILIALNTGEVEGTIIKEHTQSMERNSITNVSVVDDVAYVTVEGIGRMPKKILALFGDLAGDGINVDVISQSMHADMAFTVSRADVPRLRKILTDHELDCDHIKEDVVKVSVIGNAMRNRPGVAFQVFSALVNADIAFYQISTSEISISYIVDESEKHRIVEVLAKEFGL